MEVFANLYIESPQNVQLLFVLFLCHKDVFSVGIFLYLEVQYVCVLRR